MNPMPHICRIQAPWLRIQLLCAVWPVSTLRYVLTAALSAAWGGHPNKRRLLQGDFYALPISIFWATFDGLLVP